MVRLSSSKPPDLEPSQPAKPRAPSHAAWLAMSESQRRAAVDALPARLDEDERALPEGDPHFDAKSEARSTLRMHFERAGRRTYVGAELAEYYPDEPRYSPDVIAVCDVDQHPREKWVVDAEGRGLDWALEVMMNGDRRKDLEKNVLRHARLRIPEYFVFDRGQKTLRGWRLNDRQIGIYHPIAPQHGMLHSDVLGLDLAVDGGTLRFRQGNAMVYAASELIAWLENHVADLAVGKDEAEAQAHAPRRRARATHGRGVVRAARDGVASATWTSWAPDGCGAR